MSLEKYPQYSSEPEQTDLCVTMTGTGAASPTKTVGRGVTLLRTGTGLVQMTLGDNIGTFLGGAGGFSFQTGGAVTASQLAGWSVVFGAFDSTGKIVTMTIFNGSLAAADLLTGAVLALQMPFKAAQFTL